MDTFVHLSHQPTLLIQVIVAAWVMFGLGLEGYSAEREIQLVDESATPSA